MGLRDISGDQIADMKTESGAMGQDRGGGGEYQISGDQMSFKTSPFSGISRSEAGNRQISGDTIDFDETPSPAFMDSQVKLSKRAEAAKKGY